MKILYFFVIFLTACTSQVDIESLENDISDIRKIQAEHTSELSNLKDELRKIQGKLEEADYNTQSKLGSVESLNQTVEQLKKKLPPPISVPRSILEKDENLISSLDSTLAKDLNNSLSMIRSGDFKTAQVYLDELTAHDVTGDLTPVILYWKGISFSAMGDDKSALAKYTEIVTAFAKHPRSADALLQQILIFQKAGQKDLAKITYQKLQTDFPSSEAAIQAKSRM